MLIGRLDPWQKGLDLLIEAFAHAGLRNSGLVLVGPSCRDSRRNLERLSERHAISSQVVFAGPAFGQDRAGTCWPPPTCSSTRHAGKGSPCRCWPQRLRESHA